MSIRNALAVLALSALAAAAPARAQAAQGTAPSPDTVFDAWDKDKNKSLSLEEFKAGFQMGQAQVAVRKLHGNFVAMDKNKSNFIEQDEYANLELIKKAGAKAPAMSSFDGDKNSKLDFKEYVSLIETMVRAK